MNGPTLIRADCCQLAPIKVHTHFEPAAGFETFSHACFTLTRRGSRKYTNQSSKRVCEHSPLSYINHREMNLLHKRMSSTACTTNTLRLSRFYYSLGSECHFTVIFTLVNCQCCQESRRQQWRLPLLSEIGAPSAEQRIYFDLRERPTRRRKLGSRVLPSPDARATTVIQKLRK